MNEPLARVQPSRKRLWLNTAAVTALNQPPRVKFSVDREGWILVIVAATVDDDAAYALTRMKGAGMVGAQALITALDLPPGPVPLAPLRFDRKPALISGPLR